MQNKFAKISLLTSGALLIFILLFVPLFTIVGAVTAPFHMVSDMIRNIGDFLVPDDSYTNDVFVVIDQYFKYGEGYELLASDYKHIIVDHEDLIYVPDNYLLIPNILIGEEHPGDHLIEEEHELAYDSWIEKKYLYDKDGEPVINEETVARYVNALKKIFVIEDAPAWNPNLRSKTAIRTADTRYFVDPSLAVASLGAGPNDLLQDLNTFGFILETLCIRDLRVYADALNGSVYHFRDKDGLECDAVVHLRNGSYGLIEIKLGGDKLINEGAETLKQLYKKIDTTKMKNPSFMMVLTGIGDYAYRRTDGVYVIPIGSLKN